MRCSTTSTSWIRFPVSLTTCAPAFPRFPQQGLKQVLTDDVAGRGNAVRMSARGVPVYQFREDKQWCAAA